MFSKMKACPRVCCVCNCQIISLVWWDLFLSIFLFNLWYYISFVITNNIRFLINKLWLFPWEFNSIVCLFGIFCLFVYLGGCFLFFCYVLFVLSDCDQSLLGLSFVILKLKRLRNPVLNQRFSLDAPYLLPCV